LTPDFSHSTFAGTPQQFLEEVYGMKLWGVIRYNSKRKRWFVRGRWQGKRIQFTLIPTKSDFLPCTTEDHAKWLQVDISKE
jgi:hypothetical protein